jgi:WD40 repeat protein
LRLALSPEAAAPAAGRLPLPPGLKSRFFGDYEILSEIARGGMGVVYRARQLGLNRLVALKMVQSQQLLSAEARLRFRVEIEAVAHLHHPHIVSLYESGEHDGAHYFTMRLVEGGDLATLFQRGQPLREHVQRLVKVCRAVHYAHQRGILHRDLKPSNILVDAEGEPQVADFGLAKSLDHESGFTFTSSVLGSPNYMAPEQAAGKTRQLTTAVDVYGLGAILYHLLAGRPPFQAKTPIATLRQVVDDDPESPRAINPAVDKDIATIALKCLRKEPASRYGSAEELAQDLERWLAGRPIQARPLGPLATAWRWSRRHPTAAVLAAALTLALAALAVGTGFAAVRIQHAERQAAAHLRESLLREARSLRLGSELGHRDESLRLLREAAALGGPPEFHRRARNELLATLARTDQVYVPAPFSNAPPSPELNRMDARCRQLASVEQGTNVVLRGATNGAVLQRFSSLEGAVTRLEGFSPNGRFLALRHPASLSIWNLERGERCLGHEGTNLVFSFHPREDALLLQVAPNEAAWLELPSGQARLRWQAPAARMAGRPEGWHTLAFSPDGRALAGASGTSRAVELLDPHTGEQRRLLTNSAHTVALTWSRDSAWLAVATADSKVFIWDTASGELLWASPAMIAPAHSLAFHPQRELLALVCKDEQVRFINVLAQRFVLEHPADGQAIAFDPGGDRLGPLRAGGQWGWLERRRPTEYLEFGASEPFVNLSDARFSADGRLLAVGHVTLVVLCDAERGTSLRSLQNWHMPALAFHPLDQHLLVASRNGLTRYRPPSATDGRLTFGRQEMIHPGTGWRATAITPDGQRFAAFNVQSNAAFVFDHTLTNRLAALGPHPDADALALSPDGRWLTTASRTDRAVRLWEVSEARLHMMMPVGWDARSAFSPDGRWLAVTGERFELRETGMWKLAPSLPLREGRPILGAAAFSPDSRVLALVVNRFTVHLFDLQRFEAIGILRPPGSVEMRGLAFSPDGSRLAGFGTAARVAVWNLRELQTRLAEFGLPWDLPAHAAANP